MISVNRDRLIKMSVMGVVISPGYPGIPAIPHQIDRDGRPRLLPSLGGIVYNVRTGDSVYGWAGDNIEPCVAIKSPDAAANQALNVFACVGNEAVIMSGNAKGAKGVVTGKSGRFSEHVIIDFAPDVLEQLAFGDKIVVRAIGVGMAIDTLPGIGLKSLSPMLLDRLNLEEGGGKLSVPVTAIVPPELIGAGAGLASEGGAICIQTHGRERPQEERPRQPQTRRHRRSGRRQLHLGPRLPQGQRRHRRCIVHGQHQSRVRPGSDAAHDRTRGRDRSPAWSKASTSADCWRSEPPGSKAGPRVHQ